MSSRSSRSSRSSKSSKEDDQLMMTVGIGAVAVIVLFILYKCMSGDSEKQEDYASVKRIDCSKPDSNPLCKEELNPDESKKASIGVQLGKKLADHNDTATNSKQFATCNDDKDCPAAGAGFEKGCFNKKVCMRWKNPEALPYGFALNKK